MKSLVAYYSRYGNTARVSDAVVDALRKRGEVDIAEIDYRDRVDSVVKRVFYRIFPMLIRLSPVKIDLKEYDYLFVGIPVWGGKPSAPVTRYLILTKNTAGKKAVCLYIYSFEESVNKCAKYVESLLKRKHFSSIANVFVHWKDVGNDLYLSKAVEEALLKVS
jgi:menaquinone-dependent protoporphyrinogen IX oxidase